MSSEKKSIFEYDNYRLFLRDAYLEAKSSQKKFSYRYFAARAGYSSPNFLKLVIEGKRNLSENGIQMFARGFKLNKRESDFFRLLVRFNQAKTSSEKQACAHEILNSKKYKESHPLSEVQFNYFTHWYFSAIRALVELPGFREDPKWIAQRVRPAISAEEAKNALVQLETLGLLKRDETGALKLSEEHITSGDEVGFSAMGSYHREMMKRASESIDTIKREERDISALTLGISEEMAKKVKAFVQKFRNDLVDFVSKDEQQPTVVYQLNLQLFPLSKPTLSEEGEK